MTDKQEEPAEEPKPLLYTTIHKGSRCACQHEPLEDITCAYVRESKREVLNDRDFISHWQNDIERKRRGYTECADICGQIGLSVQKVCKENDYFAKEQKTRMTRRGLTPRADRPYLHIVKFGDRIGFVRPGKPDDIYHCNLYVSDEFKPEAPYEEGHIVALDVVKWDDVDMLDKVRAHV